MTKLIMFAVLGIRLLGQGLNVNGNWTGAINPGTVTLNFNVHLEGNGGTWNSVDQMAVVPVKGVAVAGNSVTVDIGIAKFEGTLASSGSQIDGLFKQNGAQLPLTLKRIVGEFQKKVRPQEPTRPYPYLEEDITVEGAGGIKLAGTLTKPKTAGPFAAVLLISGSGPQDRDEALMGHKPFLVFSDSLTRAGFAVLRLDDRGTGKSGGVFANATYLDKVADTLAAVKFLKSRADIDGARIGLIGHSEGGCIGPLAAVESRDIAFVVMMAGIGVTGSEALKQQGVDVTRAAGGSEKDVARQTEIQGKMFAIYSEPITGEEKRKRMHDLLGTNPQADGQIKAMESPTLRDLLAFDPGPVLRKISCPVLALNGSLDTQVSAKQNLPAIATALAQSGTKDWQITELPGLNHLFQTAKTGGIGEYSQIDETIAPLALRTVNAWLAERFLTRK